MQFTAFGLALTLLAVAAEFDANLIKVSNFKQPKMALKRGGDFWVWIYLPLWNVNGRVKSGL